ncbi:prostamide/prostaglandin F synthase-like [Pomacea canaliculata]|uniref:prostamide/prostaglandin F synthase-like n=1 Tax=Pomacea canaliculata TaxID=400727 RepID=UPI000D739FAC|nr:prostamide/prostaglandin F synthase-like [Pomacea canaliculata]XP_025083722.1 prostamide/prostaglandin F synthase-like [Pomacea canaliculata]
MGFKRMNVLSLFPALLSKVARTAFSKAKVEKVGGDLKGDGMQNGGTLVIEKGGKVLLSFKQDNPADHVNPADVLKALGIDESVPNAVDEEVDAEGSGTGCKGACALPKKEVKCTGDVCELPKKK